MLDERRIQDYRTMLADRTRMEAYLKAIRRHAPGRVVVDLGAGLAPLSLLALHAGARRVYAIESDAETLAVAAEVARNHGFGSDRFVPLHGSSLDVDLPEPADLLVSEVLDGVGIGENAHCFLADARRRFLRPGARSIPTSLELFVALADTAAERSEVEFWTRRLGRQYGLDYASVLDDLCRHRRTVTVDQKELLSPWLAWAHLDFATDSFQVPATCAVEFCSTRSGVARGVAFAFRADLDHDIHIDTRPHCAATHWQQGWLPVSAIGQVEVGETLRLRIRVGSSRHAWIPVCVEIDQFSRTDAPAGVES